MQRYVHKNTLHIHTLFSENLPVGFLPDSSLLLLFFFLRNPIGRTGIKGRGVLKRFGPNHIIEMIVTR